MRLIVYSYFCAHISQCKPCLNLNFLLLLRENAKDFYAIGYFDAKNAHRPQGAGQKKGLCCALRHLCDSLQTPVHVPGDVQITLGIPVQTSQ